MESNNLFWFHQSQIMVKLHGHMYTTHRKITDKEEEIINQYFKSAVFKNDKNVIIVNGGINRNLEKKYEEITTKHAAQEAEKFNANVEKAVKHLIDCGMEQYYFEKIGEYIIKYKELPEGKEKGEVMLGLYELAINYNKLVPADKQILDINQLLGKSNVKRKK